MKDKFRKTVKSLLLLFTLMTATSGCVDEITSEGGMQSKDGMVSINYFFEGPQVKTVAAEEIEKKITDIGIIFYNPNSGVYVGHAFSTQNTGGTCLIKLPKEITPGEKYKALIVGNYNRYKAEGLSFGDYINSYLSRTYTEMQDQMVASNDNNGRTTTPLPFNGTLIAPGSGEEALFTGPADPMTPLDVSIRFKRAVSRVNVRNMVADKLDIQWVKVCNYRPSGYFFHGDAPTTSDIIRGTGTNTGAVSAPRPSVDNTQMIVNGGLYAHTNVISYVVENDKSTTCILIAGYYKGDNPGNTTLSYYRANIAPKIGNQVLKQNYIYTVVIGAVTREGASTEEDAMNEGSSPLNYTVGENWDDDNNITVADDKGNFLTISRKSVILDCKKDLFAEVKVVVKSGSTWKTEWIENDLVVAAPSFIAKKIDNYGFQIATLQDNDMPGLENESVRKGKLKVSVDGTALALEIDVMQLTEDGDIHMLSVDGRGSFEHELTGKPETTSMKVLTGDYNSEWTAAVTSDPNNIIRSLVTRRGINGTSLSVIFHANLTESDIHTAQVTVTRQPTGTTQPVVVTFKQKPSDIKLEVYPLYTADNPLRINGFSSEIGNTIGGVHVIAKHTFLVKLPNAANYTYTATSTLPRLDAQIIKDGSAFFLEVYRTGPGDPFIDGGIVITATGSGKTHTITMPVEIYTPTIVLGDVRIGALTIADRNTGTPSKLIPAYKDALNYSNAAPTVNAEFKGEHLNFLYAINGTRCTSYGTLNYEGLDAEGWRIPQTFETETIVARMIHSKGRYFVVSDLTTDVNEEKDVPIACYFPLAGSLDQSAIAVGFYFSGPRTGDDLHILKFTNGSVRMELQPYTFYASLRCVK